MNEYEKSVLKKREAREKKKKTILIGIVICIVLIIMLAILIMYYLNVDVHTFKLYIDDQQVELGDGFYFTNDSGDTYVRARDIASYIKWSYQNGEYGSFTEDTNSGYIQNKYEIASFVAGSNVLKKYIQAEGNDKNSEQNENRQEPQTTEEGEVIYEVNSVNGTLETTTLDLPIIIQNGQIYFPLKHLSDICNCRVIYENEYRNIVCYFTRIKHS